MSHLLRQLPLFLALGIAISACDTKGLAPKGAGVKDGEAIFIQRCRDCHRVHDEGGVVGPDLSTVGARRSRAFLEQVLRDPSRKFPGATMPPYDTLPADQLRSLVDYLANLK